MREHLAFMREADSWDDFVHANWALHRRIAAICPNSLARAVYEATLGHLSAGVARTDDTVVDEDYRAVRLGVHEELVAAIAAARPDTGTRHDDDSGNGDTTMSTAEFRRYLYPEGHARIAELKGLDAYSYRDVARRSGTFTGGPIEGWTPLYRSEFRGVTADGTVREGLFPLEPAAPGEEAPAAAMVAAAEHLLRTVDDESRDRLTHEVDSSDWQTWANPEFMQFDTGLRLEFQPPRVREAALALVEASLSGTGHGLVRDMMRINGFLGDVVGLPDILNEYSYNVALYGTPDPRAPWGWQLFGHHCAVDCLVAEGRMTIGPVFLGAEPNEIDAGPHAGTRAFDDRIALGTSLMAELTPEQRERAVVYREMVDPAMPPGRVHPGDERHLAGAFQDNRVIPYEGVRVADLSPRARDLAFAIAEAFLAPLPDGPRRARTRQVRRHADDSWFAWIGGHAPGDVFHYRFQSPVLIAELDHHRGVFLDYDAPKRFHVHTVLRVPNGNDYGRSWVRQWQARRP
jgi:hypothetical protein